MSTQWTMGAHVRLLHDICGGCYPGAMIATIHKGRTARVVEVDPDAIERDGDHPFAVRFDDRLETLDDWDNVLHVGISTDHYGWDAITSDFEIID